jgi:hypothetical protein
VTQAPLSPPYSCSRSRLHAATAPIIRPKDTDRGTHVFVHRQKPDVVNRLVLGFLRA